MSDGDDILGSLPPPRVKWKEQMEDIKEATLEGSQFEAQFSDEKSSAKLAIDPLKPVTPRMSRPDTEVDTASKPRQASDATNNQTNRPKTTLRRTTSEKSAVDPETNSPAVSRKSTQESLPMSRSQQQGSAVARNQQNGNSQTRRLSTDNQKPFSQAPAKRPGSNDHINIKLAERKEGSQSQTGFIKNGINSDRSEPSSRLNSTTSFYNRSDSVQSVGRSAMKANGSRASVEPRSRPFTSTEVVQAKGKIMDHGWSSTTLSSQAPTEASDDPDQDHINVVLRVRPLNSNENTRKDQFSCTFPGSGKIEVDNNGSIRQFGYNVVFEPDATQQDLFEHSGVRKLIDMSLNGYACTALAFGQTGSGKTHTMTGPPQQFQEGKQVDPEMYGIIQRSLKYLFTQLHQQQGNKIVRASYLEIYNEQVIDLLNPNMKRYLQVRWSKNKGFYVENLFVVECETQDDLNAVLEEGKGVDASMNPVEWMEATEVGH